LSVEAMIAFPALVFVVLSLPSGRMLHFARWQFQRRLSARFAAGCGVLIVRLVSLCIAAGLVFFFLTAMPDGIVLARIAAATFLFILAVRTTLKARHFFPVASNDNQPVQKFYQIFGYAISAKISPSTEIAVPASILVLFLSPEALTREILETLAISYSASTVFSLLFYAVATRLIASRIRRENAQARKLRIEKLLRSGLPRVSARYRQDAA